MQVQNQGQTGLSEKQRIYRLARVTITKTNPKERHEVQ